MTTLLKDLIDIPEKVHKGDFVLKLAEGVDRAEETLKVYVVTPQLQDCFQDALNFVKSAIETTSSKMTYLHGSFGSGKSHFMAVLHLILENHPAARKHPDLQEVCADHNWTEGKKFLLVPYHMIGATNMESAILGGYVDYIRKHHPEAPLPAVYLSEGLFRDAERLRERMGDDTFFEHLNSGQEDDDGWGDLAGGWELAAYEQATKAPPGDLERDRLVSDLVTHHLSSYASVTVGNQEAFVPLDRGLAVMSRHAQDLGYDAVILFLDELILWLASRAGNLDFVHQEGQKLAKLVEAQEATRPVPLISFVARQRDLRELVGEHITGVERLSFDDAFRHWGGRFHTITLEDTNLPEIVSKRILKPLNEDAADQIDQAFNKTARVREEVMKVLLTSRGDRAMFRKVYPFSPALVETLVAVSGVLQRNRTALKAMVELLVRQRDRLTLGKVIPVGDLFDIVAHGEEVFTQVMREHFNSALRLYHEKFLPMLENAHEIVEQRDLPLKGNEPDDLKQRAERFINDARLVKTLLLSALVPGVESFKNLTAGRLAALNHGTIKTPLPGQESTIVLNKIKHWASQVGQLRLSEGDNPTIVLQLVGVDTDSILDHGRHEDKPGNRKRKIRELLFEAFGMDAGDLTQTHTILWRGTNREFLVEFANVRDTTPEGLRCRGDGWKLIIDFPFDEPGFGPRDDFGRLDEFRSGHEPTRTLVWLPSFLSERAQKDLGDLVVHDYVLHPERFRTFTAHLAPQDVPSARSLLDNRRSALRNRLLRHLEMAYGVADPDQDALNKALALDLNEQFQSLTPGFEPRPPVGTDLKSALEHLLGQALESQFPGHPAFPVDSRITTSQVQSVWEELQRIPGYPPAGAGVARLEVDKKLRSRVRSLAQPLHLGEMAETHFVPSRHWLVEFDKKMALEKVEQPGVGDLYRWMDDPKATGLPNFIRDLVVLYFAARTNRSLDLEGRDVEPVIGKLFPQARLVQQALPSQAAWEKSIKLAKDIFEVPCTELLTADSVSRFARLVREAAVANRQACHDLPGALLEGAQELKAAGDNPRIEAARDARKLIDLFLKPGEPHQLVERVADFQTAFSSQEIAYSIRRARANLEALRHTRFEVFGLLPEDEEAQQIRNRIADVLRSHEFVEKLAPALQKAETDAFKLLDRRKEKKTVAGKKPDGPSGGGTTVANRTRVKSGEKSGLDLARATAELDEIRQLLKDGHRLDISWTVWSDEK